MYVLKNFLLCFVPDSLPTKATDDPSAIASKLCDDRRTFSTLEKVDPKKIILIQNP